LGLSFKRFYILLVLILGIFANSNLALAEEIHIEEQEIITKIGEVMDVTESRNAEGIREQIVKVRVKNSDGYDEFFLTNSVPDFQAFAIEAKKGQRYIVNFDNQMGQVYLADHYREPVIISLIAIFFVLVILFGGMKGFKSILCLVLTGYVLVAVFIPGIKSGQSPILLAIMISSFMTALTMIFIAGFTKKALAASIGTIGGVTAAGLIAIAVIKFAPLSGMASTEAQIMVANYANKGLNYQEILAAGVLIACLGAAMDVAISIASAVQELNEANSTQSFRELFSHAMNIGKDIMATMTDTLILAYAGASLPLFILFSDEKGLRILNIEVVATELTAAVVASIGLLLSIPISGLVAAALVKYSKKKVEIING
jgi:uncharacterized membrane protein